MKRIMRPLVTVIIFAFMQNALPFQQTQSGTQSLAKVSQLLKDAIAQYGSNIKLTDFSFLKSAADKMPKSIKKFIEGTSITNAKVTENGAPDYGFNQGFTLSGDVKLGGVSMRIEIIGVEWAPNQVGYALIISPPRSWKLSSEFPEMKKADAIILDDARIVIPSFSFTDKRSGVSMGAITLNIHATTTINLPLFQKVKKWTDSLDKGFVLGNLDKLNLIIKIPPTVIGSSITIQLPIKFGVDFEQLYKARKIGSPPTIIKSFLFTGFSLTVVPFSLAFGVSASVAVGLTTQAAPLGMTAAVSFNATTFTLAGSMGKWDPAFGLKWLGLGDFGIEATFPYGSPVPGAGGLRGWMRLQNTQVWLAAYASVLPAAISGSDVATQGAVPADGPPEAPENSLLQKGEKVEEPPLEVRKLQEENAPKPKESPSPGENVEDASKPKESPAPEDAPDSEDEPDMTAPPGKPGMQIGLYARANEINFTAILELFKRMIKAEKKKDVDLKESSLPEIKLINPELRIAPIPITVAGLSISAGMTIRTGFKIGELTGGINFEITKSTLTFIGEGWLSPIDTKYFKLTGAGPDKIFGTADDGAIIHFGASIISLPPKLPELYADIRMEIPPLGMNVDLMVNIYYGGIFGKLTAAAFFNTTVADVNVKIPFTKDVKQMEMNFKVDNNLSKKIKDSVQDELKRWIGKVEQGINKARNTIQNGINKQQQKIDKEQKQHDALKAQCKEKTKGSVSKIFTKEYWKGVGYCFKEFGKDIDMSSHKVRKAFQRLGDKIVRASGVATTGFIKGLAAVADVTTALYISSIGGEITGEDLAAGKTGTFTIVLTLNAFGKQKNYEMTIGHFDLINPLENAKMIVKAIKGIFAKETSKGGVYA